MQKFSIIIAAGLTILAACSKNEPAPILSVSPDKEVIMDPSGENKTVLAVETNQSDFQFECKSEWLKVTKVKSTLELKATKNKEGKERTTIIKVTAGTAQPVEITVKQGSKLEIGDFYAGGIVFWLNPDKNGKPKGKVISMREMTLKEQQNAEKKKHGECNIQTRKFISMLGINKNISYGEVVYPINHKFTTEHWDGNSLSDGKSNTAKIFAFLDDAFKKSVGVWEYEEAPYMSTNGCELAWMRKHMINEKYNGFDDWYIPAKDELAELIKPVDGGKLLVDIVNDAIQKNNGILINQFYSDKDEPLDPGTGKYYDVWYLTSSESSADEMYIIRFNNNNPWNADNPRTEIKTIGKNDACGIIRAIRQF